MRFFCFGYNGVLVLYLSSRAGIYGTKTGMFSRKITLLFFLVRPRKLQAVLPPLCGCVYAAQTGTVSRKINLLFSLVCPRKLERLIAAKRAGVGAEPHKILRKACSPVNIATAYSRLILSTLILTKSNICAIIYTAGKLKDRHQLTGNFCHQTRERNDK